MAEAAPLLRYLSATQVAEMLACSYDAALAVVKAAGGKKIGGLVRVREDRLEEYLDRCPDAADPTSTRAPVVAACGRTSTGSTSTSRSARPKTKQRPASPSCSSVTDIWNWRPGKSR